MRIALVVGQATPPGRLSRACGALDEALRAAGEGVEVDLVDLHATRLEICDGRSEEAYDAPSRDAVGALRAADAVVLASPVYRATYPGVLKNLLDLLPLEALRGKPVGVVAMGATEHHYLAVDGDLRRVLAWFGAVTLPTSVYLTGADFAEDRSPTPGAREELGELGLSVVDLAERLRGARLGPAPLAARR